MSLDDLKLLRFTIGNVGPFRDEPTQIDFIGKVYSSNTDPQDVEPSNFFMLLSKNGYGKTTILETITALVGSLGSRHPGGPVFPGLDRDARAQLDMRLTWTIEDTTQTVLLSLWFGGSDPLNAWTPQQIDDVAQASQWAKLGFDPASGSLELASGSNELGRKLHAEVAARRGRPPSKLFGLSCDLPCVILFPASRALYAPSGQRSVMPPEAWGYQPSYRFEMDGPQWENSVDNLLIWLEWLNDGRLPELLAYLNENIFAEPGKVLLPPAREELSTFVSTSGGIHPLWQLSHGERAMLQILVRTLCHMTSNTVVLIDEIEIHLHTKWMNRLFQSLKKLLRDIPSLSIIFTTHNREIMTVFDHQTAEPGLVKGGHLIEDGLA